MDECWDNENMELMEDDCLEFLKKFFLDVFWRKGVNITTYVILFFHIPLWASQFYLYFNSFNIFEVIQYAPGSLVFLYAFASAVIPQVYKNFLKEWFDVQRKLFWSLSIGSRKVQANILRTAAYVTYIGKFNLVLAVLTYIKLVARMNVEKEWEIIYQVTFFKEHFPEQSQAFILIFCISLIYFIIPMLFPVYAFTYFALHICFQSQLVSERVVKITDNFVFDVALVTDDAYQRQVSERIRFCAIHHEAVMRFTRKCIKNGAPTAIAVITLTTFLMGSYVGLWYFDPDIDFLLLALFALVSGYTCLTAIEVEQHSEDESLRIYSSLTALPWYTFNVRNRKMLLFFMTHTTTPLTLSHYQNFPVNRTLIVKFYKIFSSLSALIATSREKIFNN